MAMNLRLTPDQDAALKALADAEGVSKNEAAARAIVDRAARLTAREDVQKLARETIAEYADVLDRLGR